MIPRKIALNKLTINGGWTIVDGLAKDSSIRRSSRTKVNGNRNINLIVKKNTQMKETSNKTEQVSKGDVILPQALLLCNSTSLKNMLKYRGTISSYNIFLRNP